MEQGQSDFIKRLIGLEESHLPDAQPAYTHRFWIYQNNVFAALQDYLNEVFPATRGVVGEAFFKQMAQVYIQTSPPFEGNVLTYGANFADICERFEGLSAMAYLTDLIQLEWALHRAYYAEDDDAIDVTSIPQDELLTMPIRLSDNIRLLSSQFPVIEIHRQSLPGYEGQVNIDLAQSQDNILVCRRAYKVEHRALTNDQRLFIRELQSSDTILECIEHTQNSVSPDELSTALGLVFELNLLREQKPEEKWQKQHEIPNMVSVDSDSEAIPVA